MRLSWEDMETMTPTILKKEEFVEENRGCTHVSFYGICLIFLGKL